MEDIQIGLIIELELLVQLSVAQMPHHTHLDNGHSHSIDLETSLAGDHSHQYKVSLINYMIFWIEIIKLKNI